ncbi:protein fosB [Tachyglossus aculeatus]|uniref:protein fosB n=1 Tax=Tachyglossus aculeatus TaxID=9261 RepID=UPI0018F2B76C|nr:protein fosB [Tachyglossus aculeatus]
MFQAFPGDYDSASRCSSSPSAESQYLSSVDSFGSPTPTAASQECTGLGEMPGSFVPTVTAITTSQDLQWLVQPTLISSMAQSQPPQPPQPPLPPLPPAVDPYDLPGTSYSSPGVSGYGAGPAPAGPVPGRPARARPRRPREETLTPEEEEKRRLRRERNKLAAAKCRNRRRELTDRLQAETDQLEEEKTELESEIAELRKEKERLEFVLAAHKPGCKIPFAEGPGGAPSEVSTFLSAAREDPFGLAPFLPPPPPPPPLPPPLPPPPHFHGHQDPGQDAPLTPSFFTHSEALGDPYPVNPSYNSSFVFTCPEVSTCGNAERNSNSEAPSDSLTSPSLLAL